VGGRKAAACPGSICPLFQRKGREAQVLNSVVWSGVMHDELQGQAAVVALCFGQSSTSASACCGPLFYSRQ